MKVDIVQIGNSRGVRLPKAILDQCGFKDQVELVVENSRVVLSPPSVREGWEAAFAADPDTEPMPDWPATMSAKADEDWTW